MLVDYQTARTLLVNQGMPPEQNSDALITRLKQGQPPIPGQVTSILLALKVAFEELRDVHELERELVCSLYLLAEESRRLFEAGRRAGVPWPPLLDEDLSRITAAVRSIFVGTWQG
ncbi:Dethiobiotin synthetase [Kovacikia minuta CCNUW1]|uniref:Dethiobiotin synthetase n=1 Tax=Kovacikia minuta TaxID=2931930 RepID=UPI001CCACF5B|nr:Dethiobiotin synthetase [Kovacikia minuta]UBF26868.1 Dethiobiotin synthetase [Kovacikia minuta CCNUW1]